MDPLRTQTINGQVVSEFYWNGRMVVYVDHQKVAGDFDLACRNLRREAPAVDVTALGHALGSPSQDVAALQSIPPSLLKGLPAGTSVAKSVDWSYPTSPNAERFGFKAAGCWTVAFVFSHDTQSIPPKAISGHHSRDDALAVARKLDLPWSSCFAHCHPEDAMLVTAT